MKASALFAALTITSYAQCPTGTPSHFMCTSAGGNTDITLFQNADLSWDGFNLGSGDHLKITSSGGLFSSSHNVGGTALIDGMITADGGFRMIAPRGIRLNGSITAPSVTLSTLPLSGGEYQGSTRVRDMLINGNIIATNGDLALLSRVQTISGNLQAPRGKVTIISADASTISQSDLSVTPDPGSFGAAQVRTRGLIRAPMVEIYSDGFIANSGGLDAPNLVTLTAPNGVAHDNRPGSFIQTGQLIVNSGFSNVLEGAIQGPVDGSNPGGVSGVAEVPDLKKGSFSGKRKLTLLPTQFSSSTVSQSRLPSVLKKLRPKPSSNQLVTRGGSKKSVKKNSFFGFVTKK